MSMDYVYRKSRRRIFCRWWLRTRPVMNVKPSPFGQHAVREFFVPWWAWPLELLHRGIFGHTKLLK